MNDKVRTRFAPSPTGYMHIGNLRTALYEYLISKSQGGDFILRIDVIDRRIILMNKIKIDISMIIDLKEKTDWL